MFCVRVLISYVIDLEIVAWAVEPGVLQAAQLGTCVAACVEGAGWVGAQIISCEDGWMDFTPIAQ